MKKTAFTAGVCFLLFLLPTLTSPGIQIDKRVERVATKLQRPQISSVTQSFYTNAINLIVNGTNFPIKYSGNIYRNIRLVSMGGAGDAKSQIFFLGGTANWTATRIDDLLSSDFLAGRKYRVGLVEFEVPGSNEKKLISNEVEYLVLMNLGTVTPDPVPLGTTEVEVTTATQLGLQGAMIVKFGGQQAQVTQWGGSGPRSFKFKVRIPHGLVVPGIHELHVEESGIVVSNKIPVRLLGAKTK